MKILHWAFILVAIILPVSFICRFMVNSRFAALKDEVRINNALDTATKDAIDQIIAVSGFDYDEEFGDVINITPSLAQESINTFFHTLAVNYNIPFKLSDTTLNGSDSSNSYIKNYFAPYVPAVLVIAYDGFYIYSQEATTNGFVYKLSSKIPYTYEFSSGGKTYTVGYTLKNDIYLYYNDKCYSGRLNYNSLNELEDIYYGRISIEDGQLPINYSEYDTDTISFITNDMSLILYSLMQREHLQFGNELMPIDGSTVPFLQDYKRNESDDGYTIGEFHKKRREVIIKLISDCLREEINVDHNRFAHMMGSTYNFYLPDISDDDWVNSIDDITVMAFVQGIPVGTLSGTYYNNYAFGGSRIVNRDFLYGNHMTSSYTGNSVALYHRKRLRTC